MSQVYRTAAAFKQALEQRLRTASASGSDFARRRQLIEFDRFLGRIFHERSSRGRQGRVVVRFVGLAAGWDPCQLWR
jgi:hypothetical protein